MHHGESQKSQKLIFEKINYFINSWGKWSREKGRRQNRAISGMRKHREDIGDITEIIRGCYEQLCTNKFENLNE